MFGHGWEMYVILAAVVAIACAYISMQSSRRAQQSQDQRAQAAEQYEDQRIVE